MATAPRLDSFNGRVSYAAECITTGRGLHSRSFDTCFEMYDGAAVVTALVRQALDNPAIAAWIPPSWHQTAAQYAAISTANLPALARQLRSNAGAPSHPHATGPFEAQPELQLC